MHTCVAWIGRLPAPAAGAAPGLRRDALAAASVLAKCHVTAYESSAAAHLTGVLAARAEAPHEPE